MKTLLLLLAAGLARLLVCETHDQPAGRHTARARTALAENSHPEKSTAPAPVACCEDAKPAPAKKPAPKPRAPRPNYLLM